MNAFFQDLLGIVIGANVMQQTGFVAYSDCTSAIRRFRQATNPIGMSTEQLQFSNTAHCFWVHEHSPLTPIMSSTEPKLLLSAPRRVPTGPQTILKFSWLTKLLVIKYHWTTPIFLKLILRQPTTYSSSLAHGLGEVHMAPLKIHSNTMHSNITSTIT